MFTQRLVRYLSQKGESETRSINNFDKNAAEDRQVLYYMDTNMEITSSRMRVNTINSEMYK